MGLQILVFCPFKKIYLNDTKIKCFNAEVSIYKFQKFLRLFGLEKEK